MTDNLLAKDYESLSDDEADILENASTDQPTNELPTEGSSKKFEKLPGPPGIKRKRSKVWKTFTLITGADKIPRSVCSKCGYSCIYESKNGTGNMLKHQKQCEDSKDIKQMVLSTNEGSMSMRSILFDPQQIPWLRE